MSRSPLAYPFARSLDADAGGAAELQTDVMRFMAILSLCLVAIFALVQSIPASPPVLSPAIERPVDTVAEPSPAAEPEKRSLAEPAPRQARQPSPAPAPVTRSSDTALAAETAAPAQDTLQPAPEPVRPEPAEAGFTLRFESDTALKALVAQNDIGLFAVAPGRAKRLAMERGRLQFRDVPMPSRMHEMDSATVPADVVRSLERVGITGNVTWGVTLPRRLSRQLDRYLANDSGGDLVIPASGDMRLE